MFAKFAVLVFVAFIFSSASALNSKEIEVPKDPSKWVFKGKQSNLKERILNGWQASDTLFPWVAQLQINTDKGGFRCSGSLIKANFLITALHCVEGGAVQTLQASFGSADSKNFRVKVFADRYYWEENEDGPKPDICIFRLERELELNQYVNVITIASIPQQYFGFSFYVLIAAGWGIDSNGGFPRYLQFTYFKEDLNVNCNFQDLDSRDIICSKSYFGGTALRGGDSGGPLVVNINNVPTLIGVNIAYSNDIQISTKVAVFWQFVNEVTGLSIKMF